MNAEPDTSRPPGTRQTPTSTLDAARAHHDAGRLREAEALYREVLRHTPDEPDALHRLGMLAYQTGRSDAALDLLDKAIAACSDRALYRHDLGNVLQARGRLDDALAAYRHAIDLDPAHADAHFNAGTVLQQQGRLDEAAACYRAALVHAPDLADAHLNLGTIEDQRGRHDAAVMHYRQALALAPRSVHAQFNLANTLRQQRRLDDAVAGYRAALALEPSNVMAHNNLGVTLLALGRHDDAAKAFADALALRPDYMPSQYGLGQAHEGQGRLEDALTRYRKALRLAPDHAGLRNDLGAALARLGHTAEAIEQYRGALALQPGLVEAHHNLGNALWLTGDALGAVQSLRQAWSLREAPQIAASLAQCLRSVERLDAIDGVDALLLRALAEHWARPEDLAQAVMRRVQDDAATGPLLAQASQPDAPPHAPLDVTGAQGLRSLHENALLRALLERVPVTSAPLARLLTRVRRALLDATRADGAVASEAALDLACTLARQCFVNEYVFECAEEEAGHAAALQAQVAAALAHGETVAPLALATLAAYVPLGFLPHIDAALERDWPTSVNAVLVQQVREPRQEQAYRAGLATLTPIRDESRAVQRQYEENPYPRWTAVAYERPARSIDAWLRGRFPAAPLQPRTGSAPDEILIAGCGTGREAVETAQRFADARVLAVDLSGASLAYAQRKSVEQGLRNVEYAQADILALGSLGRSFDVVSSVGVLHHLADPVAGLRTLTALVRPRGFMQIGLYSEAARRRVAEAQRFVREQGYAPTAPDIRRARAALLDAGGGRRFAAVTAARDFHTTSECRDLLFHVQEHRFTLTQVRDLLLDLRLRMLGFVLDPAVLMRYGERFRGDTAMVDLDGWAAFETQHPDTFAGMYVMWAQKL